MGAGVLGRRSLCFSSAIYGADVAGSVSDPDLAVWSISHLNTILDDLERDSGQKLPGVNTAYLYFGAV
jgi:jumonji domain-containing protein 2